MPSRLLNVSASDDKTRIRLVDGRTVTAGQYIALSHCWGQKTPEWRTLQGNLEDRRQGFSLGSLPKTLKDAIGVTRQLGVGYLWIDSLCIIQDDEADWKKESAQMDAVFASAYCTIAASAAPDSEAGFLKEKVMADGSPESDDDLSPESDDDLSPESDDDLSLESDDDLSHEFDDDLKESPLNKRAWVLQESYLSPRTIHFSANRVYGECGDGIYTGNVLLRSSRGTRKHFQHDPRFPDRLRSSGLGPTMKFLQSLIEDYSGRGISKDTDRPIAIQGLMDRIANALPSKIYHGIVHWYLHRSLLWRRKDSPKTPQIFVDRRVPTWSWMAYPGGISFAADDCEWSRLDVIKNVKVENDTLQTLIWKFAGSDTRMERGGDADLQVLDSKGLKGWISLDTEVEPLNVPKFVVLARLEKSREDGSRYFVLFVEQHGSGNYERIGVGMIHGGCELASLGQHCIV